MPVYVDKIQKYPRDDIKPRARRYGLHWCHMTADTVPELLIMAQEIGLKYEYMQRSASGISHFDLTESKRRKAVRLGAIEI